MNTRLFLALAAVFFATPSSIAHEPAGTPKNSCEDPSEFAIHDYAPVAVGMFNFLIRDGNLLGDCNGDTVPADFDGHLEWAQGGALILAESGDGVTSGSIACYGAIADHAQFGPFLVVDATFGANVPYFVGSDIISLVPPADPTQPECGDGFVDETAVCTGVCIVTFPGGLDGAYSVNVGAFTSPGTMGHVCSPASACLDPFFVGVPLSDCTDGRDNDGDGKRDWVPLPGGHPDKSCGLPTDSESSRSNALTGLVGQCLDFVDNDDDDERDWVDLLGLIRFTGDSDQCSDPLDPSEGP